MTINNPDTEQRIADRIRRGGCASAEELVEQAIKRFLTEEEKRVDFGHAVREGLQDEAEGRIRPARAALTELGSKLGFHG